MFKSAREIRQEFFDFFNSKEHKVVPSSPVVLADDPTLLFTNAGMNQFKSIFLGQINKSYSRVVDSQKCIRVSGKHNDLEEVGRDGYHHTFFEMLGNWSFGDYYKKEAIEFAWELLTQVFNLEKDRLFITVYKDDQEAFELWSKIVPKEKIFYFDEKDNFWEMGEVGPCGPCSEIHYDRTEGKSGASLINADHEDVIEIWNLVFIQYNRKKDGSLEELADKHIDTGMGFERLVSVIQGKNNNYETDLFEQILFDIAKFTGKSYQENKVAFQVIADHIRMVSFAIADGAVPSNTGRGYVVRRIIRRASRFLYNLGLTKAGLYKLLPALVKTYEGIFPEIKQQKDYIQNILEKEEEAFLKNLQRGLGIFVEETKALSAGQEISAELVFKLYDTYGFPYDMTQQMAQEKSLKVDYDKYQEKINKAKEKSRQAMQKININDWQVLNEQESLFVGYKELEIESKILRYRTIEKKKNCYELVLANNPFYAESGGQIGDKGIIEIDGARLVVYDTQKQDGESICFVKLLNGDLLLDENTNVLARVDIQRREMICINHTSTHLLHQVLREVLGNHIEQRGSLVEKDYLRFDFSHFEGISQEKLAQIEALVNKKVRENISCDIAEVPIKEAKEAGARALFGEKYGDIVRMVKLGDFSLELCGGTHINNTGEIGAFKILSEASVSSGIRRIEAISGEQAIEQSFNNYSLLQEIARLTKTKIDSSILNKVQQLSQQLKQLQKSNEQLNQQLLQNKLVDLEKEIISKDVMKVLAIRIDKMLMNDLKYFAFQLLAKYNNLLLCIISKDEKTNLVIAVAETLQDKFKANELIKEYTPLIQGGGGGNSKISQAVGKSSENIEQIITSIKNLA